MLKTLNNHFKENKERFYVPKGVQEVLPVHAIYEDGIFLVRKANLFGENKYSRTWKFTDINYAVASREDKESMFLDYSELLNSLDSGAAAKLTIRARRLSKADYEANILIPMAGDSLDKYRKELNAMLLKKVTESNAIVLDKLVTISVCKKNIEEARAYFARIGADLASHFSQLGSKCMELDVNERLKIFHDFYRPGEESAFHFDLSAAMRRGHSFKDYICPDSMEFDKNFFKVGERFGRVLFLKEYASYIKDTMIAELTELNQNMTLSIDIRPVTMEEAVREVEKRVLGVETNITNWQRRQNSNNNFSAIIPYDMEQQRKESREFLDDITSRDQRMTFATITVVHTAATKEQLDADTESLLSTARKNLCQLAPLTFQQLDGLNTVLPFGHMKIQAVRTLTTESLAVLMPFKVQEVMDRGGIYYGQNAISHNLIMCLKEYLLNPNGAYCKGTGTPRKTQAVKPFAAQMDGHPQERNGTRTERRAATTAKNISNRRGKGSDLPPFFLPLVEGSNQSMALLYYTSKTRERRFTSVFYTISIHNSITKGAKTMQTVLTSGDKKRKATEAAHFKKRIGSTTYVVSVHFSRTSRETVEDKILKLIESEAKKTA